MSMREQITGAFGIAPCADPKQLSALTLAYLGDTIYDLYARTLLAMESDAKVHALHLMSNRLVCAKGQAEAFFRVQGMLDEEELSAFRRGRNAHSATVPKNADVRDYRIATGFESLLGYLYCLGRDARIGEIMKTALGKDEA